MTLPRLFFSLILFLFDTFYILLESVKFVIQDILSKIDHAPRDSLQNNVC